MIIEDKEFGEVIVRRSPLARGVKFSISTSGRLAMSVPKRVNTCHIVWNTTLNGMGTHILNVV